MIMIWMKVLVVLGVTSQAKADPVTLAWVGGSVTCPASLFSTRGCCVMRSGANDDSFPVTRSELLVRGGVGLAAAFPFFSVSLESSAETSQGGGLVTVLGSGGKTGGECVKYLAQRGTGVRAVARSLINSQGETLSFDNLEGASGMVLLGTADVTQKETLPDVIRGSSAVIFASSASKQGGSAKDVDYQVPRLVVVSSGGVASPDSSIYKFLNLFGEIMTWKIRGENQMRAMYKAQGPNAPCSYTIVRPGGLTLDSPKGVTEIEINQGDTKSGRIARADVAGVCVEAAFSLAAKDCTLECYWKDTAKSLEGVGVSNILKQTNPTPERFGTELQGQTWEEIFSGLKRDA